MKVLVLYQFKNHDQLLNALYENLNKKNVEADIFNISTWYFKSKENKLPLHLMVLRKLLFHYKLKLLILKIFPFILTSLLKKYTIVDIHFFGSIYFKIIDILLQLSKKVKITIWGSDFYRIPVKIKEKQGFYYSKIDSIHVGTEQMKSDFLTFYNDYSDKISLARFGILQFDVMNQISSAETLIKSKQNLNLPIDKLIVTLGYNGSKGQQHLLMLEALTNLSLSLKKNIFVLLPMTYGASKNYIIEIESKLKTLDVAYTILSKTLTVDDIGRLRLCSNITVNTQISDAFSASIQEHIYAQNIVVVGDWLPYNKLLENQIFYLKTDLNHLSDAINDVITNYNEYKGKSIENKEKIERLSSWDNVIIDWINIYKSLH